MAKNYTLNMCKDIIKIKDNEIQSLKEEIETLREEIAELLSDNWSSKYLAQENDDYRNAIIDFVTDFLGVGNIPVRCDDPRFDKLIKVLYY